MSQTHRDSTRLKNRGVRLEVIRKRDGTFDLFCNNKLDQSGIIEKWLPETLCVSYGFCGQECENIMSQVNESGRTIVIL